MTWLDFFRFYDPSYTQEECEYALWTFTAFPFGDARYLSYQVRRAIRVKQHAQWNNPYWLYLAMMISDDEFVRRLKNYNPINTGDGK